LTQKLVERLAALQIVESRLNWYPRTEEDRRPVKDIGVAGRNFVKAHHSVVPSDPVFPARYDHAVSLRQPSSPIAGRPAGHSFITAVAAGLARATSPSP
jgi:hypothetical protein